jgi:hypothetical protein
MKQAWDMFRFFGWPIFIPIAALCAVIALLMVIWNKEP